MPARRRKRVFQRTYGGGLSIQQPRVLVAEPLVMIFGVKNAGSRVIPIQEDRWENFDSSTSFGFRVRSKDGKTMAIHPTAHLNIATFDLRIGAVLHPGASVRARKIVPLMEMGEERYPKFLPAGDYKITGRVWVTVKEEGKIRSLELTTPEYDIVVVPLEPEAKLALDLLKSLRYVYIQAMLTGQGGVATKEMTELAASLRTRFPRLPHCAFLDYQLLRVTEEDLGAYRIASQEYLERYASTPFRDEILYRLAREEARKGDKRKADNMLTTLSKEHPDSPLSDAVSRELTRLREGHKTEPE